MLVITRTVHNTWNVRPAHEPLQHAAEVHGMMTTEPVVQAQWFTEPPHRGSEIFREVFPQGREEYLGPGLLACIIGEEWQIFSTGVLLPQGARIGAIVTRERWHPVYTVAPGPAAYYLEHERQYTALEMLPVLTMKYWGRESQR